MYLTNREIHVIGIQRTGQHAITSWLIGHFESVCYKNHMSQKGSKKTSIGIEPPFWYFSPSERDSWEVDTSELILPNQEAIILGTELINCEIGLNPNLSKQKLDIAKRSGFEKFSKKQNHILVIRNPYNHYASVLKWRRNKILSPYSTFSSSWIDMARECLGETNLIQGPKTVVNYDLWFSSQDERKRIANELELNFTDRRLNIVMKIGVGKLWGSSFDGMHKKHEAQDMNVLERWKRVAQDERFIRLLNNESVCDLAKKFGWEKPL